MLASIFQNDNDLFKWVILDWTVQCPNYIWLGRASTIQATSYIDAIWHSWHRYRLGMQYEPKYCVLHETISWSYSTPKLSLDVPFILWQVFCLKCQSTVIGGMRQYHPCVYCPQTNQVPQPLSLKAFHPIYVQCRWRASQIIFQVCGSNLLPITHRQPS